MLLDSTAGFFTERGPNLGCICTRKTQLHMHDQRALFGSRGTWSAQTDSDTCYAHITLCLPAREDAHAHTAGTVPLRLPDTPVERKNFVPVRIVDAGT